MHVANRATNPAARLFLCTARGIVLAGSPRGDEPNRLTDIASIADNTPRPRC